MQNSPCSPQPLALLLITLRNQNTIHFADYCDSAIYIHCFIARLPTCSYKNLKFLAYALIGPSEFSKIQKTLRVAPVTLLLAIYSAQSICSVLLLGCLLAHEAWLEQI